MKDNGLAPRLLETVGRKFPVKALDAGSAAKCKAGPMRFRISHYEVEGIGHLSVMEGSAMLGLMKMDTVILTPLRRDAPLFSYDRIKAMGNDTLILEYYDTLVDSGLREDFEGALDRRETLKDIPDHDLGAHWYDPLKLSPCLSKRGKGCARRFDDCLWDSLAAYLDSVAAAPEVDAARKKESSAAYVNGLFENGGPSTDAFVKALGREAATELFETVIFGTR